MVAKKGKRRALIAIGAIFMLLAALATYVVANLNPIVIAMAEARARQLAVAAINRAVAQVMLDSVSYSDLIQVSTDGNGRVTLIRANTILMNELASRTALTVQKNLAELEDEGVTLPLGSAFGIKVLSSSGPNIVVGVLPVGSITTRFVTAFETAGINQTRHEISLEASTQMRIVIPTGAATVNVTTTVPVAEAIIVGEVPASYVNVPDVDSMLNLIPND
jgi:sporulation protein YunB